MDRISTTLRITQKQADELDYYANKIGLSRNQLLVNVINVELENLLILDKLGILRVGAGIRDLLDFARNQDDMNALETR